MLGTKNAGYEIIAIVPSAGFNQDAHVVTAVDNYGNAVTWETHLQGGERSFYWGHYFTARTGHVARREALLDMVDRAVLNDRPITGVAVTDDGETVMPWEYGC